MKFNAGSRAEVSSREGMPHFMHKNRDEHDRSPDRYFHPIRWSARAHAASEQNGGEPKPPLDHDGNPKQSKFQHAPLLNEQPSFCEMKSPAPTNISDSYRSSA